jgi:hypothetical protein
MSSIRFDEDAGVISHYFRRRHHHHHHRRAATSRSINNSNQCPPSSSAATSATKSTTTPRISWSDLVKLERYTSAPASPLICTLIPANRTASFLWNAAASRIVEWTSLALFKVDNTGGGVSHSQQHQQQQQQLEQKLMHMIRHDWRPQQMRRSLKGYPKSSVWNALLHKIHQRLVYVTTTSTEDDATTIPKTGAATKQTPPPPPVVRILIFTPRLAANDDRDGDVVAAWQDALQSLLNQIFLHANDDGHGHLNKKKKLVFQVQVQACSTAFTTQVYTESIRHGLFHHHQAISDDDDPSGSSSSRHPPDLILHAMGHADMMMHSRLLEQHDNAYDDILQTVNFTDNLRHALQHFLRASLVSAATAPREQCQQHDHEQLSLPIPPAVLLVNDYYNHRQEYYQQHHHDDGDKNGNNDKINGHDREDYLFLKEAIYSRVVQQLADHYQLGFISHAASGIQRQEWINTATKHTTTTNTARGEPARQLDSQTNSKGKNTMLADEGRHSIQILWTLLFSMLQYSIDECSNLENQTSRATRTKAAAAAATTTTTTALVPTEHLHRIENVIPPYLDGNFSLRNVSPLWQQQEVLQRKQAAAAIAQSCGAVVATPATATTKEQGDASGRGGDSSIDIPLCSLALGPPMTAVDWRRKLASVLPSSTNQHHLQQQDIINATSLAVSTNTDPGWNVLEDGILRAAGKGAHLSLHVPFGDQQQQQDEREQKQPGQQRMRAILFVVHQTIGVRPPTSTSEHVSAAPTILQWSIQTEINKAFTRQVTATTYHDHSDSRTTPVALPYVIEWTHGSTTTTRDVIKVDLQLVQGGGAITKATPIVDIAAFFICRILD